jgi:signal transduction histidine kinase
MVTGRAIMERRTVHVADLQAETDEYPEGSNRARSIGFRTILAVPLIRGGDAIGVIAIRRREARPFTDRHIELVTTFADQAVIAIENTRLFEAEQASKRELQESLEYQTATADVLAVISSSPNQLQPVLDAIVRIAFRLCPSDRALIMLRDGACFRLVARNGYAPPDEIREHMLQTLPIDRGSVFGRVALERRTIHVADVKSDPEYTFMPGLREDDRRTVLGVPLVRGDEVAGVIVLIRNRVEPYGARQIELIKTFADQAVIAIGNTRLFEAEQASKRELEASLDYQTATSDVLNIIGRSPTDARPAFDVIAKSAARLCAAQFCHVFRFDGYLLHFSASQGLAPEAIALIRQGYPMLPARASISGRAILSRAVEMIPDIDSDAAYGRAGTARAIGYRSIVAVPMLRDSQPVGAIVVGRAEPGLFSSHQIDLLKTFADQAVIAIENTRLFEEVQARTHELAKTVEDLEIASQHKSQFVANMSHELRTPLAAILGYAELMQEGFYEPLGTKSLDALTRIRSNGKHLLGLINTVLDIAKIESGQFSLNLVEYAIESVVETVRAATESLAETKMLALKTDVAKKLPVGIGDEQRLTQVLLNLVGNAIKFTDTGEVRIAATAVNGHFNITVIDTGPGIPQDHQARIFEQFHQVDNSNTKAKGGTGLGLAIAKQIVEMHGGRIWVESTVGKGSTFQMQLPIRAEFRKTTA